MTRILDRLAPLANDFQVQSPLHRNVGQGRKPLIEVNARSGGDETVLAAFSEHLPSVRERACQDLKRDERNHDAEVEGQAGGRTGHMPHGVEVNALRSGILRVAAT
jgi:hypothetical protein